LLLYNVQDISNQLETTLESSMLISCHYKWSQLVKRQESLAAARWS